jgi:hypothetical protein
MAIPKFPSKFLKLGSNVSDGDVIRFLDAPTMDADDKLICNVGIIPKGFKEMTERKKFQVNKTNYKATAAIFGPDCDHWVGKEMQVYEGVANNPSNGQEVPTIKLKQVGGVDPEEVDFSEEES